MSPAGLENPDTEPKCVDRVRIVELPSKRSPPPIRGILRKPTQKFPEHPDLVREGVAPLKVAVKKGIPPSARWTKIDRRLVNPEALQQAGERFEERLDCVIVLRVLTKQEIQSLADLTAKIRSEREDKHNRNRNEKRMRVDVNPDGDYDYTDAAGMYRDTEPRFRRRRRGSFDRPVNILVIHGKNEGASRKGDGVSRVPKNQKSTLGKFSGSRTSTTHGRTTDGRMSETQSPSAVESDANASNLFSEAKNGKEICHQFDSDEEPQRREEQVQTDVNPSLANEEEGDSERWHRKQQGIQAVVIPQEDDEEDDEPDSYRSNSSWESDNSSLFDKAEVGSLSSKATTYSSRSKSSTTPSYSSRTSSQKLHPRKRRINLRGISYGDGFVFRERGDVFVREKSQKPNLEHHRTTFSQLSQDDGGDLPLVHDGDSRKSQLQMRKTKLWLQHQAVEPGSDEAEEAIIDREAKLLEELQRVKLERDVSLAKSAKLEYILGGHVKIAEHSFMALESRVNAIENGLLDLRYNMNATNFLDFSVPFKGSLSGMARLTNQLKRYARSKPQAGYTRLEWKCVCGDEMYGDYLSSDPNKLQMLKSLISHGTVHERTNDDINGQGNGLEDQKTNLPISRASTGATSNSQDTQTASFNTSSSTTELPIISHEDMKISTSSQRVARFLEVCVNVGTLKTNLGEIRVTPEPGADPSQEIRADALLFQKIYERYFEIRKRNLFRLLYQPRDIQFVRFSLIEGHRVGIYEKPSSIPPKIEVEKGCYDYYECPMDPFPPIDSRTFFHYFWKHKKHINTSQNVFLNRLPKKLNESLHKQHDQNKLQLAWGIHIIERPNRQAICWTFVAILIVSFVVSLTYDLITRSSDSGFAIGQWLVAVLTSMLTAIYFSLDEP